VPEQAASSQVCRAAIMQVMHTMRSPNDLLQYVSRHVVLVKLHLEVHGATPVGVYRALFAFIMRILPRRTHAVCTGDVQA
jgi:hypothetical protein